MEEEDCIIDLARQHVKANLNMLPLGSYDMLIGMDWLEQHRTLVNCKDKTINFLSHDIIRTKI